MTSPPRPESPPASRVVAFLTGASLFAAVAWLISRVWLGVAFTDEMQYYGEISSLTRTGRFFTDDMFVQQLGYLFVLPFFKLHAFFYPDQSYFILFGRLLLLAAYGITGAVFWRAAGRLGGFSRTQKLAGLAAFFAFVPFQIFAFSYNTDSYLLGVALVAGWISRDPAKPTRYALATAGLLTALTYTYPPAGLVLILVAVIEADRRLGRRAALLLLGATALFGVAVLGLIALLQGHTIVTDLIDTVNFSRGFGEGDAIRARDQYTGLLVLLLITGCFLLRWRRGRVFSHPLGLESPPLLRWTALAGLVMGGGALLGLIVNWKTGYIAATMYPALLMVLAASVGPPDGLPPVLRADNGALFRWTLVAALAAGGAAMLVAGLQWGTGYYATAVYLVVLLLLAAFAGPEESPAPVGLVVIGTVLGTIFSVTSGNGAHNYGVGVAAVIPFLFLYCARSADQAGNDRARRLAGLALPALVCLWLLNGAFRPYGEQRVWNAFQPIVNVPAFRGIWSSPEKIEAIGRFQTLAPPGSLEGKRLLVIGPQPWLYFALGGQPATPMRFLHYLGRDEAYTVVAERLFRGGLPDVIVLTNTNLPRQIAAQLGEWSKQKYTVSRMTLPADFIHRYGGQVGFDFSPEVFLLSRPPAHP